MVHIYHSSLSPCDTRCLHCSSSQLQVSETITTTGETQGELLAPTVDRGQRIYENDITYEKLAHHCSMEWFTSNAYWFLFSMFLLTTSCVQNLSPIYLLLTHFASGCLQLFLQIILWRLYHTCFLMELCVNSSPQYTQELYS